MSTVTSSLGSARNSSHVQRRGSSTSPTIEKSQRSSGVWGVGPAERTGKSLVRYCPGGTRSPGPSSRRPLKPREMIGGIAPPVGDGVRLASPWRMVASDAARPLPGHGGSVRRGHYPLMRLLRVGDHRAVRSPGVVWIRPESAGSHWDRLWSAARTASAATPQDVEIAPPARRIYECRQSRAEQARKEHR